MRGLRARLTYANVMSTLAVVIALGTGTAYAANTVFSEDIVNGQVKTVDLGKDAVTSGKVGNEGLTGADVKDQSGVDTCVVAVRLGTQCYRVENLARRFFEALAHCTNLGMRLPTYAEAFQLVHIRDVPGIGEDEFFWTDEFIDVEHVRAMSDSEGETTLDVFRDDHTAETVCVTVPTN